MAYRRPAVTVIQEFVGLQPALAAFALPSVIIGPSYQLVTDDNLGSYNGSEAVLDYVGAPAGSLVDLETPPAVDAFPSTRFPLSVRLKNTVVTVVASSVSQAPTNALTFNDNTSPTQFADVIAGDKVVVPSGSNAGTYVVRAVVNDTRLTLQSPLPDPSASTIAYSVTRLYASVDLEATDFSADETSVTVNAGLSYLTYPVVAGTVLATYRALRNDLALAVVQYDGLTDVQAAFGVSQITPANPLAYGLQVALQNTVTPVNGLGLSTLYATDEVAAHQESFEVIKTTDMYALCPLSQNPVLHPIYKTFVVGESAPDKAREKVALVNRSLVTVLTLQNTQTTTASLVNARTVVTTQTSGTTSSPYTTLGSVALFGGVKRGDTVVVTGGTNAIPGSYNVVTVTSSSALVLSAAFCSTASATDIAYYIVRKDGVSADGLHLYDRNATFLSSGVSTGHYINVTGPSNVVGRYKVASTLSENEVLLAAPINGVTSLVASVVYDAERDMTRNEQATFLQSYSAAIGSRRIANIWPDQLQAPVGNTIQTVPGFYGGCAIAAMTTGLPTQQGFTNLSLSGFLGLFHSSKYFNDDQLDVIASGGTMILAQAGPQQPLFVRHQLTTDMSAIKFQEFSITKNVDFVAKFLRRQYANFIGPYNIIQTTLDDLKTTAKGAMTFLVEDSRLPKIGGVLRSGSLVSLAQDPNNIDTVKIRFKFDIPIPLNHIDITIQV